MNCFTEADMCFHYDSRDLLCLCCISFCPRLRSRQFRFLNRLTLVIWPKSVLGICRHFKTTRCKCVSCKVFFLVLFFEVTFSDFWYFCDFLFIEKSLEETFNHNIQFKYSHTINASHKSVHTKTTKSHMFRQHLRSRHVAALKTLTCPLYFQ